MASVYEILLLMNAQYTGQGTFGLLSRDIQGAQNAVSRLGASFKSTSSLATVAAKAQNELNIANKAAAVAQNALSTSTSLTGVQMKAYNQIMLDQQAAQRTATAAGADLQASMEGAGGALAGLGTGAAIVGVIALGVAIKNAVQDSNAFNEALSKVQANTSATTSNIKALSQASLNLGASGTVPYNATQLAAGSYLGYSANEPANVVTQSLGLVAKTSEVLRQPDLTTAQGSITSLQAAFGGGGQKATLASLTKYADMVIAAERYGKVTSPGQIASNVGRFAGPSAAVGVTAPEALSFVAAETETGLPPLRATQYLTSLESALFSKPNKQQQTAAARAGLTIGPTALAHYGGLYATLAAYQQAASVNGKLDPQALATLLGQKPALAGFELVANQGFGTAAGWQRGIANSQGAVQQKYQVSQQSPVQQWAETGARLHTDLTTFGNAITMNFEPPALKLANALLGFTEDLGSALGKIGNVVTDTTHALAKPVGDLATNIAKSAPAQAVTGNNPIAHLLGWSAQHVLLPFVPGAGLPQSLSNVAALAGGAGGALGWMGQHLQPGLEGHGVAPTVPSIPMIQSAVDQAVARAMPAPQQSSAGMLNPWTMQRIGQQQQQLQQRQAVQGTVGGSTSGLAQTAHRAALALTDPLTAALTQMEQARVDAIKSAATTTKKAPRTGKVGPELIRQTGTDYYDRYALFNEARAAYGSSAVRLTGGSSADTQQQALRKADAQIAQLQETVRTLKDLVQAIFTGNTLSRQQVALEQQIAGAVNRPLPATQANAPQRLLGAIVR